MTDFGGFSTPREFMVVSILPDTKCLLWEYLVPSFYILNFPIPFHILPIICITLPSSPSSYFITLYMELTSDGSILHILPPPPSPLLCPTIPLPLNTPPLNLYFRNPPTSIPTNLPLPTYNKLHLLPPHRTPSPPCDRLNVHLAESSG